MYTECFKYGMIIKGGVLDYENDISTKKETEI